MLASSFLPFQIDVLAQAVPVGGYISIWKSVVLLILVMIWARLLTWTDKDTEAAMLPRRAAEHGVHVRLHHRAGLFFFLPGFAAGIVAMFAIFIIEIVTYLVMRNNKVGLKDLKLQFKDWVNGFKPKGKEKKGVKGEVTFIGKHGNLEPPEGENIQAEQAGYNAMQEIFSDPIKKNAEKIEAVTGEQRSSVRYWVDGMPYDGSAVSKNDLAMGIQLLKQNLGLDTGDRRKPQSATMKVMIDGTKHETKIQTAGSTAGRVADRRDQPEDAARAENRPAWIHERAASTRTRHGHRSQRYRARCVSARARLNDTGVRDPACPRCVPHAHPNRRTRTQVELEGITTERVPPERRRAKKRSRSTGLCRRSRRS